MNFQSTMLREGNQIQKATHCMSFCDILKEMKLYIEEIDQQLSNTGDEGRR